MASRKPSIANKVASPPPPSGPSPGPLVGLQERPLDDDIGILLEHLRVLPQVVAHDGQSPIARRNLVRKTGLHQRDDQWRSSGHASEEFRIEARLFLAARDRAR